MSPLCPEGHDSETTDYCDQCGRPIDSSGVSKPEEPASEEPEPALEAPEALEDEDTSPATRHDPCPVCATPRSRDDRFCEACGYDFRAAANGTAAVVGGTRWEVVACASAEQFERAATSGIQFPADFAERRFVLDRPCLRIGRSRNDDEAKPEIDLAGSPEDPGISRLHAALERQDDGSYAVRDLGSTNGTTLNDDPQPLTRDVTVPVAAGDRIRIGAWTTITVERR